MNVIVPVLTPLVVGSKETKTVQVPLGGSVFTQLLTSTKSGELGVSGVTPTGELLMLVTVTDCWALDVPTYCGVNERLAGLTETVAVGGVYGVPVPVTGTFIA